MKPYCSQYFKCYSVAKIIPKTCKNQQCFKMATNFLEVTTAAILSIMALHSFISEWSIFSYYCL